MALPPPLRPPPSQPSRDDDTDAFCASVSVYPLIHEIRVDVAGHIDTPLTYEQLVAPDSTYTIIRPLTEKYLGLGNPAVVFCLLLNKVQFVSDSSQVSIATLSSSRATLCEILAIRVLRGWSDHSLPLATVLLTPWPLFQGAPEEVLAGAKEEGEEDALDDHGTALEMAIISQSKVFIRSPSCQKVIEGIWSGKIIYTSLNAHAFIQDTYKKRPIQIYNPHRAPFLDHYRLKVPKYRAILDYANFVILFVLYCIAIERGQRDYINVPEAVFIVYALAFSLDKLATIREHGLKVFASSMVNGFDLIFVFIFATYLGARILGTLWHNASYMEVGTDLMAVGAVLMFPRLVFMSLANNLMVLSIRSMLTEFFFLMSVGIFCFLGFIYALRTLTDTIQVSTICWWLLEIYFGLDATGFETSCKVRRRTDLTADQFHPYLGPILMVIYAFLSNTLLTVVCVAVLGNTFAAINADASAESMFRKAVSTIEGVKADMVFSYQLPFNLIALAVLYPLKYWLSDRWFHKVNVFMIRLTNLPVLLVISFYERQKYSQSSWWEQLCDFTDHYIGRLSTATEGIVGARIDISAVFDLEREYGHYYEGLDDDVFDEDEEDDDECEGDEEENISLDAGLLSGNGQGVISLSPDQESFPTPQQSPNVPRFRRRSSVGGAGGNGTGAGPGAPLQRSMSGATGPRQRVRRNSTLFSGPASLFNGPSPLARIYTRGDDGPGAHLGPIRRSTLAVGSLPVTGMSGSPRRNLRASGGSGGSSAFSSSVSASPPISKSQRPSVTPIDERSPTTASPAGPGEAGGKVQFPKRSDETPARVTFDKLPSPGQRRSSATTTPPVALTPQQSTTPAAPTTEAIAPEATAPPPGADPDTPPPRARTVSAGSRTEDRPGTPRSETKTASELKPTGEAKAAPKTTSPHVAPGKDDTKADKSKALIRADAVAAAAAAVHGGAQLQAKRPGVAPTKMSSNSSPSLRNVSGATTGSRAPPSPNANLKLLPGPQSGTASPMLKPGGGTATPAGKPKTASELLESMEAHNAHTEHRVDVRSVESQLAAVEARQQRMEEMIQRLLDCSQSQRGVNIRRRGANDEHDTFDDSI